MKKLWVLMFVILLGHNVHAQSTLPAIPLIFSSYRDLYAYRESTGETRQLTSCQCVWTPNISADGRYVAYFDDWDVAEEYFTARGLPVAHPIPSNIQVIDLTTYETFLIADQPADASYAFNNETDRAVVRTNLNWSPENHELAWVEYSLPHNFTSQVVIYNFDTQTQRIVSREGEWVTHAGGNPLSWGESGLIYLSFVRATQSQVVTVVNPDGSEIYTGVYNENIAPAWIDLEGRDYLIWSRDQDNHHFTLFDPRTEYLLEKDGRIVACSALVENSFCSYTDDSDFANPRSYIISPDGTIEEAQYSITPAADGQAYAYHDAAGQGYIWRNGATISLSLMIYVESFDWGPLEFRLIAP